MQILLPCKLRGQRAGFAQVGSTDVSMSRLATEGFFCNCELEGILFGYFNCNLRLILPAWPPVRSEERLRTVSCHLTTEHR